MKTRAPNWAPAGVKAVNNMFNETLSKAKGKETKKLVHKTPSFLYAAAGCCGRLAGKTVLGDMEDSDSHASRFHQWLVCIEKEPAHAIKHFRYFRYLRAHDKMDCKILVSTCSELGLQVWGQFKTATLAEDEAEAFVGQAPKSATAKGIIQMLIDFGHWSKMNGPSASDDNGG